ncbi:Hypothetical protein D9617_36g063080 [Elsinoe fawcettii]|nr:Hypothetical protein D9617_36g063080 [Elsinoe fawcettii]
MAPGAISSAITSIDPTIDTNTLEVRTSNGEAGASQQPLRYRDIRLDDQPEAPPATNDLSAYIKPAKQKKRKGQATKDTAADAPPGSNLSCPVCGDFQGDEAAVAHHVQGHFD